MSNASLAPRPSAAGPTSQSSLWAAFSLAALLLLVYPLYSQDTFMYLGAGRELWRLGAFPRDQVFAAGLQTPWPATAWLFSAGLWALYAAGGISALIAAKALCGLGAHALLAKRAASRGLGLPVAALASLAVLLDIRMDWTERPQALSFLFFILALGRLSAKAKATDAWLFFGLAAVWSNVHDSVTLLIQVLGLAWIVGWAQDGGREGAHRGRILLAAAAGSLLNPQPGRAYRLAAGWLFGDQDARQLIPEWGPTLWREHPLWAPALLLAALAALTLLRRRRWVEAALLAVFAALSVKFSRMLPFFYFSLLLLGPLALPQGPLPAWTRRGAWRWALALLVLLWGLRQPQLARLGVLKPRFPERIGSLLQASPPQGRLFNTAMHGDYLIFKMGPQAKVFMDSRLGLVYPVSRLFLQAGLEQGRSDWRQVFDQAGISAALLPLLPQAPPLAALLSQDPAWHCVDFEDAAVLFARADEQGKPGGPPWPRYPGLDPVQHRLQPSPALLKALQTRLKTRPDALGAYYLGLCHEGLGQGSAAAKAYRICLSMDPGRPEALAALQRLGERP